MTSTRATRLTFAILTTAILMAVVVALLFATPNGAFAAGPERPTDLTATAVDHDTVSLTWSHPDPASVNHYQVLSRRVGSGAGQLLQVGTSTTTSFVHDGLESESTYVYRVKPVNSEGEEGRRSPHAEATTPAEETPESESDPTPDPTPAHPQKSDDEENDNTARSSHNVLLSNTGETVITTSGSTAFLAQRFQSGASASGYTIAEVDVFIGDFGTNTTVVNIRENNSTNRPGALVATLTNPATFTTDALNTFTAPSDTTINGSTNYWITVNDGLTNRGHFRSTNGDGETGETGETGWTIDNARIWRTDESGPWAVDSVNLVMAVKGSANTSTNNAPTFDDGATANRSIAENSAAGHNVGGTLTATDGDGDTLTYTLEGTDQASFQLVTVSAAAQIRTKSGVTYNYEVKASYTVTIKADDGNGGTDTVTVNITLTDVNEPPSTPSAPSVSGTPGSDTSLTISWSAPGNTGPDINNYDLQYRQGNSGNFTNGPQNISGTTTTIPNLSANTSYQVQVRATNA